MNAPWSIIAELESNNSRLFKESIILREAENNNVEFFKHLKDALDPLVTFGVKQVPEKTELHGTGLNPFIFEKIKYQLINRTLTGNAARDAIFSMMDQATFSEWNLWYRRILIKDLRCGVSEKTVNNVVSKKFPKFSIPKFSCQLAQDGAELIDTIKGKKLLDVKLDGVRVLSIVYLNGKVELFSRNGKQFWNFPHIQEQFRNAAKEFPENIGEGAVFDGEIVSDSFQELMKQVYRKEDADASDATLYLFDVIPLTAFKEGTFTSKQKERRLWLKSFCDKNSHNFKDINVLDYTEVDFDTEEGLSTFKAYNKEAINNKFEGIMIKDPNAPYESKRTKSWLKLKPFIEVTLTVKKTIEGTGKYAGMMGSLECEGIDDEKLIQTNVGSGFTDRQRIDFWECRADGYDIEVRADAITQNQDGTYSLRFPRFKTFRGFYKGEKI